MTERQALSRARKLLGKGAELVRRPTALTGEAYQEARAALRAHRESPPPADATPEEARAWRRELHRLRDLVLVRRCTVVERIATPDGAFQLSYRRVWGDGDNWAEALEAAEASRRREVRNHL